jgi:hypothetical protein
LLEPVGQRAVGDVGEPRLERSAGGEQEVGDGDVVAPLLAVVS